MFPSLFRPFTTDDRVKPLHSTVTCKQAFHREKNNQDCQNTQVCNKDARARGKECLKQLLKDFHFPFNLIDNSPH